MSLSVEERLRLVTAERDAERERFRKEHLRLSEKLQELADRNRDIEERLRQQNSGVVAVPQSPRLGIGAFYGVEKSTPVVSAPKFASQRGPNLQGMPKVVTQKPGAFRRRLSIRKAQVSHKQTDQTVRHLQEQLQHTSTLSDIQFMLLHIKGLDEEQIQKVWETIACHVLGCEGGRIYFVTHINHKTMLVSPHESKDKGLGDSLATVPVPRGGRTSITSGRRSIRSTAFAGKELSPAGNILPMGNGCVGVAAQLGSSVELSRRDESPYLTDQALDQYRCQLACPVFLPEGEGISPTFLQTAMPNPTLLGLAQSGTGKSGATTNATTSGISSGVSTGMTTGVTTGPTTGPNTAYASPSTSDPPTRTPSLPVSQPGSAVPSEPHSVRPSRTTSPSGSDCTSGRISAFERDDDDSLFEAENPNILFDSDEISHRSAWLNQQDVRELGLKEITLSNRVTAVLEVHNKVGRAFFNSEDRLVIEQLSRIFSEFLLNVDLSSTAKHLHDYAFSHAPALSASMALLIRRQVLPGNASETDDLTNKVMSVMPQAVSLFHFALDPNNPNVVTMDFNTLSQSILYAMHHGRVPMSDVLTKPEQPWLLDAELSFAALDGAMGKAGLLKKHILQNIPEHFFQDGKLYFHLPRLFNFVKTTSSVFTCAFKNPNQTQPVMSVNKDEFLFLLSTCLVDKRGELFVEEVMPEDSSSRDQLMSILDGIDPDEPKGHAPVAPNPYLTRLQGLRLKKKFLSNIAKSRRKSSKRLSLSAASLPTVELLTDGDELLTSDDDFVDADDTQFSSFPVEVTASIVERLLDSIVSLCDLSDNLSFMGFVGTQAFNLYRFFDIPGEPRISEELASELRIAAKGLSPLYQEDSVVSLSFILLKDSGNSKRDWMHPISSNRLALTALPLQETLAMLGLSSVQDFAVERRRLQQKQHAQRKKETRRRAIRKWKTVVSSLLTEQATGQDSALTSLSPSGSATSLSDQVDQSSETLSHSQSLTGSGFLGQSGSDIFGQKSDIPDLVRKNIGRMYAMNKFGEQVEVIAKLADFLNSGVQTMSHHELLRAFTTFVNNTLKCEYTQVLLPNALESVTQDDAVFLPDDMLYGAPTVLLSYSNEYSPIEIHYPETATKPMVIPLRLDGLATEAITSAQSAIVNEAYSHRFFSAEFDTFIESRTRNVLVVPIFFADNLYDRAKSDDTSMGVIGVLEVRNKMSAPELHQFDLHLLEFFSQLLTFIFTHQRLYAAYKQGKSFETYYNAILHSTSEYYLLFTTDGLLHNLSTTVIDFFDLPSDLDMSRQHSMHIFDNYPHLVYDINKFLTEWHSIVKLSYTHREYEINGKTLNYSITPLVEKDEFQGLLVVVEDISAQRKIMQTLARYLSSSVASQVVSVDGLKLGGTRQKVTVLFADIRSYTQLSEGMDAEELVRLLNSYFEFIVGDIFAENGVLDKFIGDAVMAVWGVPFANEDDAIRACRAYFAMEKDLEEFNAARIRDNLMPIRIGAGIATGVVLSGNIGCKQRLEYTVIGDAVNLASRLESITKQYKVTSVISQSTYQDVRENFIVRELDYIRVVGKKVPEHIYQLIAPLDAEIDRQRLNMLSMYATGLDLYRRKLYLPASAFFEHALDICPDDGPSRVMRGRCADLAAKKLQLKDAVWNFQSK